MGKAWQLQEAKNKFSNLVDRAQDEGPQVVTRRGKEAVVVLSAEDYKKLTKPKMDLFKFIQKSPLAGEDLEVLRDQMPPRDVSI
jgi:antitoxin Phd